MLKISIIEPMLNQLHASK